VHGVGVDSSQFHLHLIDIDIIYDIDVDINIDTYKPSQISQKKRVRVDACALIFKKHEDYLSERDIASASASS
jgi:hypothetical protein